MVKTRIVDTQTNHRGITLNTDKHEGEASSILKCLYFRNSSMDSLEMMVVSHFDDARIARLGRSPQTSVFGTMD